MALVEMGDGAPRRTTLEEALEAARTAAVVTRQLLAFSQRRIVEPRVLDLNEHVRGLQGVMQRVAGEHVGLHTRLRAGPAQLKADPGDLEQILVNLVVNARDAMPTGGEIVLSTRNLVASEAQAAQHSIRAGQRFVALEVEDTGIGMTEHVRLHLFEPFFTTKGGGHGAGLGLAAMYGSVKSAGGFVEVESELDVGTTMRVAWPEAEKAQDARPAGLFSKLPSGRETILIVEDETVVRALACRVLRRAGYQVMEAGCAEDALVLGTATTGAIDVLLTDVVMPGMSGRALAERWKALHPESVVLLTSGHTDDTMIQQGVIDGEMAFLSKPYSIEVLVRRVRSLLDERRVG